MMSSRWKIKLSGAKILKRTQSEIGSRPVDKSALYGGTTRQRFKDLEVQQQSWMSELNNDIIEQMLTRITKGEHTEILKQENAMVAHISASWLWNEL